MTFDEFIGDWDKGEYAASLRSLEEPQLRRLHYDIRQKVMSADAAAGGSFAAGFFTGGAAFAGTALSYRRRRYNAQKLDMIEARMDEKSWEPSELRKRDFFKAVAPGAVAAAVVPGLDSVVSNFVGHAVGHGAAAFTSHHAGDVLNAAVHHKVDLVRGIGDGVSAQVHALTDTIMGHAPHLVSIDDVASNSTNFLGNMVGQAAASAVEVEAVSQATNQALKYGVRGYLSAIFDVSTTSSHNSTQSGSSSEMTPSDLYTGAASDASSENEICPADIAAAVVLPAIIRSILGFRSLCVATLVALIWDAYKSDKTALITVWSYISLPAAISLIFGERVLWFGTFAFEVFFVIKTLDREVINSQQLAFVFFPLIFCAEGRLRGYAIGSFVMAVIVLIIEFCISEEKDRFVEPSFRGRLSRPDYYAFALIPFILYCRGAYQAFWLGCSLMALGISVMDYKYGVTKLFCLITFRQWIQDQNRFLQVALIFGFGFLSGGVFILAGAMYWWLVFIGGLYMCLALLDR